MLRRTSRGVRDRHPRVADRSRGATRRAMSRRVLLVAVAACVAACSDASTRSGSSSPAVGSVSSVPGETSTAPVTIFSDDFAGTAVDPAKWTVFDRLSDQANGEVNCVAPENVTVSDGLLHIESKFEDRSCGDSLESARTLHYTSGQIQQATSPFLYGTVEVRAKAPGGIGTWPAIWMLGFEWQASQPFTANTPEHKQTAGWSEIDIAEFWRNARNEVNTTVHYIRPGGLHIQPFRSMRPRASWSIASSGHRGHWSGPWTPRMVKGSASSIPSVDRRTCPTCRCTSSSTRPSGE